MEDKMTKEEREKVNKLIKKALKLDKEGKLEAFFMIVSDDKNLSGVVVGRIGEVLIGISGIKAELFNGIDDVKTGIKLFMASQSDEKDTMAKLFAKKMANETFNDIKESLDA